MKASIEAGGQSRLRSGLRDFAEKASAKFFITPENIAQVAYPHVEFIREQQPDYVLVCDRGARLFGLSVAMLYRELYGTLPTQDKNFLIRKISRKDPPEFLRDQLRADVAHMMETTESPTVLVMDDWVLTGKTKTLASDLISEFSDGRAKVLFGVMRGRGKGADISGDKFSPIAYYTWRNNSDVMGVEYDSDMQPHRVGSPEAILYRKRIANNVKQFAGRVKARQDRST